MNDQKNKQQPQGNDKNQNKSGQQDDKQQGGQARSGGGQTGAQQQTPHNTAHKSGAVNDPQRQQPQGSEIENPDMDNEPGKKVNIDDDPEQTKKKVPNMHKDQ